MKTDEEEENPEVLLQMCRDVKKHTEGPRGFQRSGPGASHTQTRTRTRSQPYSDPDPDPDPEPAILRPGPGAGASHTQTRTRSQNDPYSDPEPEPAILRPGPGAGASHTQTRSRSEPDMEQQGRLCSVWLGSETGILKGVSVARRQAFNFCSGGKPSRAQEVRVLAWSGPEQSGLLLGSADGSVRTFSPDLGVFTATRRCGDARDGGFTGLGALPGGALLTCAERGAVRVWREDSAEPVSELNAGASVCRMRQSPVNAQRVATGGKENGLKLWDLNRSEPVFTAKNLRDDFLDLRRPYWVRDLDFIPESDKVVTCTGYHQVHVFDPSGPQRRPVLEAEFGEHPLTALAVLGGGAAVAVGNTVGQVAVLDLRKGAVRGVLKGATGGVRALQADASGRLLASCGLDRFLRLHRLHDRTLLHKVYLKSRLNCLLLSGLPLDGGEGEGPGGGAVKEEEEDDGDEVWGVMERLDDETAKRRPPEDEREDERETMTTKTKKKRKK